jgi:SAM-dependent methyltransferase
LSADPIADLVDAGSREHYSDAALYDYEYRRRRADVGFYRELAKQRLGSSGRILELGAGSGRVTIALARAGYEVVAVDASRPMLAKLRARVSALPSAVARRITVVEGDLRDFTVAAPSSEARSKRPVRDAVEVRADVPSPRGRTREATPATSSRTHRGAEQRTGDPSASKRARGAMNTTAPEQFPLVLAVFNVLEHLYTRVELDACLRRVIAHLAPGGAFAFDVQLPDLGWLLRDPVKRWAKTRFTDPTTGRAMFYSTNHDYDPVGQIALIRIYYEPVDGKGPTRIVKLSQRKYFPAELEALVAHAGMRVIERYGDFLWRPLDGAAESQVLVCEATISVGPAALAPRSPRRSQARSRDER